MAPPNTTVSNADLQRAAEQLRADDELHALVDASPVSNSPFDHLLISADGDPGQDPDITYAVISDAAEYGEEGVLAAYYTEDDSLNPRAHPDGESLLVPTLRDALVFARRWVV